MAILILGSGIYVTSQYFGWGSSFATLDTSTETGFLSSETGIEPRDLSIALTIQEEFESRGYRNVRVDVFGGKVYLSGSVPQQEDLDAVQEIATQADGVEEIQSNITVLEDGKEKGKKRNEEKGNRLYLTYSI